MGGEELIPEILEGKLEFNTCLATKSMFPQVIKIAKYLGPKGLMPSPAKGTVSDSIADMMASVKSLTKFEMDSNRLVTLGTFALAHLRNCQIRLESDSNLGKSGSRREICRGC